MYNIHYDPILLRLCRATTSDLQLAETIVLQKIPLNEPFVPQGESYPTTYLAETLVSENYAVSKLLLQYGADPNQYIEDKPVFWNLKYPIYHAADQNQNRLQIAAVFLQSGADPNIYWENESLFDYVISCIFHDYFSYKLFGEKTDTEEFRYISTFLILLILYGGASIYHPIKIHHPLYKEHWHSYTLQVLEDPPESYPSIQILDAAGTIVAVL